jgi:hypothetical protein
VQADGRAKPGHDGLGVIELDRTPLWLSRKSRKFPARCKKFPARAAKIPCESGKKSLPDSMEFHVFNALP